jgi:hypothetical protein
MKPSIRIQRKILTYSFLFKVLGIIDNDEYIRIKKCFLVKEKINTKVE